MGWTTSGNLTLAFSVVLFLTVAWYHNRLEDRLHRLRRWRNIKQTHLARIHLNWPDIPLHPVTVPEGTAMPKTWTSPPTFVAPSDRHHHFVAGPTTPDLVAAGAAVAHRCVENPPGPHPRTDPFALLRDRLILEAQAVEDADIDGRRLLAVLQKRVDDSGLIPMLITETALTVTTAALLLADLLYTDLGTIGCCRSDSTRSCSCPCAAGRKRFSTMPNRYISNSNGSVQCSGI